MQYTSLLLLAFISGATILLGLPVARLKSFSPTLRGALSMLAAGILIYLLVDILGDATADTAEALKDAAAGAEGYVLILMMAAGFLVGFVGLVVFEQRMIRGGGSVTAERLSLMIAVGIGLHNLSEGLAIGQSYIQQKIGLAVTLIIGFGLHNATEGFGIVGPVMQKGSRPSWGRILLLAAIGGGPTFVGSLVGSLWTSTYLSVAVLAMAGGALLYVIKELFASARKEAHQVVIMTSVVLGFVLAWATNFIASIGAASA